MPLRRMRPVLALLLAALAGWGLPLAAQEDAEAAPPAAVALERVIGLFAEGKLPEAVAQCSELVATSTDPLVQARGYAMLALAFRLQDLSDVADRIGAMRDLCAEDETLDRDVLLPVLDCLAGQRPPGELVAALQAATPDWSAFGVLCAYVMTLAANPDPQPLHPLYRQYADAVAVMSGRDWVAAWSRRVPLWQKCLQEKDRSEPLEPLVAARIPDRAQEQATADRALAARQAAFATINRIVELYLADHRAEAEAAAGQPFAAAGDLASGDAPGIAKVLAYLAGAGGVTARDLFLSCQTNPQVWALGCIAMFARDVAAAAGPDQLSQPTLLSHLDNFRGNLAAAQGVPEVAGWEQAIGRWEQWCASGFVPAEGLPPLLAARSRGGAAAALAAKFNSLAGLTPEAFAAGREERYGSRPRPATLAFTANQIERYVASAPAELQDLERRRAKVVGAIRPQLVRIFERSPYRGQILLRNGGTKSGAIVRANDNFLVFKRNERSRSSDRILWSDLALEQYCAFFEHFARIRLAMGASGETTAEERQFDAANDYLGLALLCDWYGSYPKALEYARKAVATSPKIEAAAAALLRP